MASFTIRYLENKFQLSSDSPTNVGGYGYVEILLIGVKSFSSGIRGKKFFWVSKGQRANPFDDCIAYLGKLLQGRWISEDEYHAFVQTSNDAWAKFDAIQLSACAPESRETVAKAPQWDLVPYRWESTEAVKSLLDSNGVGRKNR